MTECAGEGHCTTCADEARPAVVLRLLDDGFADVDTGGGGIERISVALVDAGAGDTVLVHAKEAIGVVT
ncbi:hydrogenase assembly protein HupF [Actinomadura sp. NAK00032]|uniref:HypC/HybG/HupF family hydrogenase formation chaperone n=1 Tax=Actinomadura sp. NAK00032 TaxID=2742128 RepID=UPI001590AED0|nr:HypC/HybG/HupF family hydrogenase formation chaperone [Actinomadura sp. NAK00032]QKW33989.1 hydrogenase assembly protein HupF [Actinomadura sp. NAK00032]